MSAPGDYPFEMRKLRPLDDRAIEAFFTGHALPGEDPLLGSFAQSIRAFANQPVAPPRGELAAMLANGLITEKGNLLVTAASNVTGPHREASALPKWRRPSMTISALLSTLLTKLGAFGLAAKGGLAIALTSAGVLTAGAAGALPGPVQNTVAHAVAVVTPITFPTTTDSHAGFGDKTSTTAHEKHGVSDPTVSTSANSQGSTEKTTPTTGPPTNPGTQSSTGLNQANSTPAAGHVPTSVPAPTDPGSQSVTSPGTGSQTTASTTGPPTNPGSQSSTGLNQANSTPAAGHVPTSVPTPTDPGSHSGTSTGAGSPPSGTGKP